MGKAKRLKGVSRNKVDKKSIPTFLSILKIWWTEKHPVLVFISKFSFFLILFHLARYTSFYIETIHPALTAGNAWLSHLILNLFGQNTIAEGAAVNSDLFSMSIVHGCDAVEAVMIYVSVILAFPVQFSKKIIGALSGTIILLAINLIRVVSLFLIGVYFSEWFEFAHIEAWQFIFILLALVMCASWIKWAIKSSAPKTHA